MTDMLTPREKLATAILRAVEPPVGIAPYFGVMMRGLVRRESPGLGTLGVTKDGVLLWDPAFVDKVSPVELAGVLVHEVMHIVLKHHERAEALGIVPEPTAEMANAAFIANLAMDCAINTELVKSIKLPDPTLPEKFNMPPGLTFEEYYARLRQQLKPPQDEGGNGDGKDGSGDPKDGKGQGKPKSGGGWCGSCAGHPMPGEPPGSKNEDGRSEAEMERLRKQVAEDIKGMGEKARGTVPASLQRWADEYLKPAKVDWRTKLSRIVRGAVAYKSGQSDYTFSRISRRQAGVGFGIGRPVVPALHSPVPSVALAIDTSGSMSESDLTMALSELSGVLAATGSNVMVLTCDAEVHEVKDVRTAQEAARLLKGGGGTSMTPIFNELETRRDRPAVTIVCTDGHIGNGHPHEEPRWTKTIWVVVGKNGNVSCCPWGEIIHVSDDE